MYRVNDGYGSYSDIGQNLGGEDGCVELGDLDCDGDLDDHDGDLDAFVAHYIGQSNKVFLNDGTGIFSDSGQTLGDADNRGVAIGTLR